MFGNLLGRSMIERYRDAGIIKISSNQRPDKEKLGVSTYTLYAGTVYYEQLLDGKYDRYEHSLSEPYDLDSDEYVRVVPSEKIVLAEGIVARYCATSDLIREGLELVAGKLDPGFGSKEDEHVMFGLKNISGRRVTITRDTRIAHMSFFDLRAFPEPPDEDEKVAWQVDFAKQYAEDFAARLQAESARRGKHGHGHP